MESDTWQILVLALLFASLLIFLKPLMNIGTYISRGIKKLLRDKFNRDQPYNTEGNLKTVVDVGEEDILEIEEKEMIYNIFEFGYLQVKDVMVQRVDIVAIELSSSYDEAMDIIKKEQFSRIPIYNGTIDDIVGILYVKDLIFMNYDKDNTEFSLKKYMREPYHTFEFKKVINLLSDMKRDKNHMAVVLDEYGGTVGIVTIEDLIEEIVGEISDEYDEDESEINVIKEDEYLVTGSIRLEDFNDLIGTSIESDEFDSVGGFIINQLGRLPESKEEIQYNNIKFIIEDLDKNRIKKVRILVNSNEKVYE